jgi:hypothetical protein
MKQGLWGTETPLRVWRSTYQDYVLEFRRYYVRVVNQYMSVGDSLLVTRKRELPDEAWREDIRVDLTLADDAGFFDGIWGDLMFIDSGCCPGPRGLAVYDLVQRKSVYSADYEDWPTDGPTLRKGRWLTYLEALPESAWPHFSCPECERTGMGTGYVEKVVLDLQSLQLARSGDIRCSCQE